jgi:hypothetical protein
MCLPNFFPTVSHDTAILIAHIVSILGLIAEIVGVTFITARDSTRVRERIPSLFKSKPDRLLKLKHDLFGSVRSIEKEVEQNNELVGRDYLDNSDPEFELFYDTIVPEIWKDQGITSFRLIGQKVEEGEGVGDFGDKDEVKVRIQPDSAPGIHVDNCVDRIMDEFTASYYVKGWAVVGVGFGALLVAQFIRLCVFL